MFETEKVRTHGKFRNEWSQRYNKCKSHMGQDQVSGGVFVHILSIFICSIIENVIIVGVNDFTRCFFCAGGLRDWEPNDNPWIEHARWYENCVFVRQCKGEEFVNLVKQGKIDEATQIVRQSHTDGNLHMLLPE